MPTWSCSSSTAPRCSRSSTGPGVAVKEISRSACRSRMGRRRATSRAWSPRRQAVQHPDGERVDASSSLTSAGAGGRRRQPDAVGCSGRHADVHVARAGRGAAQIPVGPVQPRQRDVRDVPAGRHSAPTTVAVLRRVSEAVPRPIREINPDVPDDLCAVIARLQAKNPADRFPTAAEVADVLRQYLARLRPSDPVLPPVPGRPGDGRNWRFPLYAVATAVGFAFLLLAVGRLSGYLSFGARAVGPAPVEATRLEPIRVGVLHSQTGTMGSSESAAIDATLLAIEEINQGGGLLGRPVEPVVADGMSDCPTYAREAERLIATERACAIFGCWTSASRKAVTPVVAKHDHLLVYPMQHEGLEQSPHVVYTGAAPNQQVTPRYAGVSRTWASGSFSRRVRLRLPAGDRRSDPRPRRGLGRDGRRRGVVAAGERRGRRRRGGDSAGQTRCDPRDDRRG